jgi:hypothetical protein
MSRCASKHRLSVALEPCAQRAVARRCRACRCWQTGTRWHHLGKLPEAAARHQRRARGQRRRALPPPRGPLVCSATPAYDWQVWTTATSMSWLFLDHRLIFKDFEEGSGPVPEEGQEVVFNYTVRGPR